MIHYKNLHSLFFESFPNQASEFIALTGFVGLDSISELSGLPFPSTVIYGLFKENQNKIIHDRLTGMHTEGRRILYPELACHSKCYLWLNEGRPIKGYMGSANFSPNGLKNDYRETLIEVDQNQLFVLKGYIEIIQGTATPCTDWEVREREEFEEEYDKEICDMVLYDPRTGQTQEGHGLNWGLAEGSHVRPNDACIPIRTHHIRKYPDLFPAIPHDIDRGRGSLKEIVEFIWDDGLIMQGRLEGSQPIDGIKHPKQLASFPHKDDLGKYFRDRMGIDHDIRITREDLVKYGRSDVSVSMLSEGSYFCDFSV
jgi:hypothetical protein